MGGKQTAKQVEEPSEPPPSRSELEAMGVDTRANWWTRAQVARGTGLTVSGVRQREKRGDFIVEKCRRGEQEVWLFDPQQFENYDPEGDESAQASFMNGASKLLHDLGELARGAYDQSRLMVKEVLALTTNTNAQLVEMVKTQQTQVLELQKNNFEMRKQFEESLTEQHERDLARQMMVNEDNRKDRRWQDVAPLLKHVAAHFAKQKLGLEIPASDPAKQTIDAPRGDETNPWRGLLAGLTLDQASKLVDSGAFDAEWLQTNAYALRVKFEQFTDEPNVAIISNEVEQLLLKLTTEQKVALRSVLTPVQTQYLDAIEQIREPAATKETVNA